MIVYSPLESTVSSVVNTLLLLFLWSVFWVGLCILACSYLFIFAYLSWRTSVKLKTQFLLFLLNIFKINTFALYLGDKTRPPSSSPSSIIRRTSSLDTLAAPYLAGHWPRDSRGQATPCMRDKATQVGFFYLFFPEALSTHQNFPRSFSEVLPSDILLDLFRHR